MTPSEPKAMVPRDGEHYTPSSQGLSVVVYSYRSCPFFNRVAAFLDHHSVPYVVVEVNPLFKREARWQSYKRLPFAIVNGRQVNDSDLIIDTVAELLRKSRPASPPPSAMGSDGEDSLCEWALRSPAGAAGVRELSEAEAARESKWRAWCNEHFVHTLSPNIYRTPREAWQSFEYIGSVSFSSLYGFPAQVVGAAIMYLVGKRVARRHGYDPNNLRGVLYDHIGVWTREALEGGDRAFCGGEQPNVADIVVFGAIRAIEGLDSFNDVMDNTDIHGWYTRMQDAVGESSCHHRAFTKGTSVAPGPHAPPPGLGSSRS